MAIIELYSHRNKPTYPDVYQYEWVTPKLRNQISKIIVDAVTYPSSGHGFFVDFYDAFNQDVNVFDWIYKTLSHEYGETNLRQSQSKNHDWFIAAFAQANTSKLMDLLDLTLRVMDKYLRNYYEFHNQTEVSYSHEIDAAISEINERMRRDGFGYEFTDGQLIRVDNQYVHAEVVKPALLILQDFDGAREEFLSAHEHYKHGAYEECIADCNKSFESLMKGICHERGWEYDNTAQAKKLIKTCLDNELIPSYLQEQFAQYLNLLSSGIPTIRNKEAGHGQGNEVKDPAQSLTSYALHLTASNLVFLGECNKAFR